MIAIDEESKGMTKCGTWLYLSVQIFEGDNPLNHHCFGDEGPISHTYSTLIVLLCH
ncbi:hypothetical protein Fmac_003282 [Flemingia macrophylla]|uniref:Uncharacterized protein n=1 Tax=Flemingia macrophylla TaxID=520843 RepID=A0ABD1NMD4_9FABA